jgi:hypothetical protein
MARLYEIDGVWQGRKVRHKDTPQGDYVYYHGGMFVNSNQSFQCIVGFEDWEPYTEPKKKRKVKLYRYTFEVISRHVIIQSNFSDEIWEKYLEGSSNLKLLHTEEKELEIEVDDD